MILKIMLFMAIVVTSYYSTFAMFSENAAGLAAYQETDSSSSEEIEIQIFSERIRTAEMYEDYYGYSESLSTLYAQNIRGKIDSLNFAYKISIECTKEVIKNAFRDEKPLSLIILSCYEPCINSFIKAFNNDTDKTLEELHNIFELFVFRAINRIYKTYIEPYNYNYPLNSKDSSEVFKRTLSSDEEEQEHIEVDYNLEYNLRKKHGARNYQRKKLKKHGK